MRCHASNGWVHTRSQLILVADVPTDGFETLAAPHTALLSVKAEAPRLNLFSLPRIVVEVKPSPGGGGGLGDAPARVEFRLVRGGDKDAFHSFGGALDKTRERAVRRESKLGMLGEVPEFNLMILRIRGLNKPKISLRKCAYKRKNRDVRMPV